MKKGNKNNIFYIVIACIVAIILLSLAGVSLYKVINIENDSIPEVIGEIDNSKKNTTKLANEITDKVNSLDEKTSEELANINKTQKIRQKSLIFLIFRAIFMLFPFKKQFLFSS